MSSRLIVEVVIAWGLTGFDVSSAWVGGQAPSDSIGPSVSSASEANVAVGSIRALHLESSQKSVEITTRDGKVLSLTVDPKATSISENGPWLEPDQLHVGQIVRVQTEPRNGKNLATSIEVVPSDQGVRSATPAAGRADRGNGSSRPGASITGPVTSAGGVGPSDAMYLNDQSNPNLNDELSHRRGARVDR